MKPESTYSIQIDKFHWGCVRFVPLTSRSEGGSEEGGGVVTRGGARERRRSSEALSGPAAVQPLHSGHARNLNYGH